MERLLWDEDGDRLVPGVAAFDRAAARLPPGMLFRICELNPHGPIYVLPTAPFLRALARRIRRLRRPHRPGSGRGRRSSGALAPRNRPRPERRRHRLGDLDPSRRPHVAARAPRLPRQGRRRPAARPRRAPPRGDRGHPHAAAGSRARELAAPGPLLGRIIRAAPLVLEIGAGSGITGDIRCWRYPHEFCEDLDALGRCRLDERPARRLHTRVTLYRR